jgi:hypothetical protein
MNFALALLLFAQIMMHTPATDTSIYAEVKGSISSDRSHPGDRVEMVVLEDWRDNAGHLLIPVKAKLTGRIVLAIKHRGTQPGTLSIVVENGEWRGGRMPLHATIQNLVVMGVKHVSADMPLKRGVDGQDIGMSGTSHTSLDPVPKDCTVQPIEQLEVDSAVTCKKRDVHFREGGQVLLVDHPKHEQ